MKAELLQMSHQEQLRSEIMRLYVEGYIKQKDAATLALCQSVNKRLTFTCNRCSFTISGSRFEGEAKGYGLHQSKSGTKGA